MKKSYLTAVLMLMCLLGAGVVSARAQSTDAVVVNVPFEFVTYQCGWTFIRGRISFLSDTS